MEMDEQTTELVQDILNTCDDLMQKMQTVRQGQAFLKSTEPLLTNNELRDKNHETYAKGEEVLARLKAFYSLETNLGNLLLRMFDSKLGYSEADQKHIIISV